MVEPIWAGREDAGTARRFDRPVPAEQPAQAISARRPAIRPRSNVQAVLGLQRAAGNAAVASMLAGRSPAGKEGTAGPLAVAADTPVSAAPAESNLAVAIEVRPLAPEGSPPTDAAPAGDGTDTNAPAPDLFLMPDPLETEAEPAEAPQTPVVQRWPNPLALAGNIARGGVDLVRGAVDSVGDLAGAALGAARARITALTAALRSGGQAVQSAAAAVSSGVGTAVRTGSQAIGQLGSRLSAGLSQGLSAATGTINGLTSGFSALMRLGLSAVTSSAGALGRSLAAMDAEGIRAAWARIQSLIGQSFGRLSAAGSALTQRAESLWTGLTQRFSAATQRLSSFGMAMLGQLRAATSAAVASITGAWQGLSQRAAQMDGIGGTLARVAVAVVERLMSGLRAVWQQVSAAWTAVRGSLAQATERVSAAIATVREAASRQLHGLVDRARASVTALVTRARALVQRTLGGMTGLIGQISSFSLDKLVSTVSVISGFLAAVKQARAEASAALERRAEQIAAIIQSQMPGAAAEQVRQHVGGGASAPPGPAIQRTVAHAAGQRPLDDGRRRCLEHDLERDQTQVGPGQRQEARA